MRGTFDGYRRARRRRSAVHAIDARPVTVRELLSEGDEKHLVSHRTDPDREARHRKGRAVSPARGALHEARAAAAVPHRHASIELVTASVRMGLIMSTTVDSVTPLT